MSQESKHPCQGFSVHPNRLTEGTQQQCTLPATDVVLWGSGTESTGLAAVGEEHDEAGSMYEREERLELMHVMLSYGGMGRESGLVDLIVKIDGQEHVAELGIGLR